MTNQQIDLTADVIDVRDIIARVEELEESKDCHVLGAPDGTETPAPELWARDNPEDAQELETLQAILADLAGNGGDEQWRGDWYPVTLIRESYFADYCQDLVIDCGGLPASIPDYLVIDWEATSRNLKVDYSEVEIDGATYFYR